MQIDIHAIIILLKCTMAVLSFRADKKKHMHCTLRKSKFIRLLKFVKNISSFRANLKHVLHFTQTEFTPPPPPVFDKMAHSPCSCTGCDSSSSVVLRMSRMLILGLTPRTFRPVGVQCDGGLIIDPTSLSPSSGTWALSHSFDLIMQLWLIQNW